ncbi:2-deoxy-5-keto-D-gluconate 6-phosphate aldolase domain-containing protein [Actinoplanes sp. NPDC051494]|uniref:2-deoxy-5-keto-D-gluconate 6-phosphate aldolase domain-containing protein n=1 Tax=Actinoplanes sp. NPDC051494 TaxID=3363907 RepID=UPI0037B8796B
MTWEPRHDDPLLILAMDHRDSFGKKLFAVQDDDPDAERRTAMQAAKKLIFDGLREAVPRLSAGRAGVLVDEEYGQAVVDEVRAGAGGIMLAVPLEASGQEWFSPLHGVQWPEHVEDLRPDYAKILIRDNPGLERGRREQQFDLLTDVSDRLREMKIPLLYELLVPAVGEQAALDPDTYDRDVRPDLVTRVIADNQEHGVAPALWKVEGLETVDAARQVAAQAAKGDADLIVLGRDAPRERLHHWLEVASQVPEFVGFAIGRSIWQDVVREHNEHHDDARARTAIADRYLDCVAHWRP